MIPLRIRVEGATRGDPFVVRLSGATADTTVRGPWDALLVHSEDEKCAYQTRHGELRLSGIRSSDLAGDVLLVDPTRKVGHRLLRSDSPHNAFLVTERCDQICTMCSQPPKEHHVDLFPLFQQAAILAPKGMTIGITGGEPMLFKDQVYELLRRTQAARPDLSFHVLTNAQHFDETDVDTLRELPSGKVLWGVPLYAREPGLHDEIVGKHGAFAKLMDSLGVLARGGASIELRTVVLQSNAPALESLAEYVSLQLPFISKWAIMQLENIGYGRMNWDKLFFDNSECFAPIGPAIDIARGRGLNVALYNFPLCTVPESYRAFAAPSISDWKQRYLRECDGCVSRKDCGGFFTWYPEARGFSRLGLEHIEA